MDKPDIKRLKYPLWFKIVFYLLTTLIPIIIIMVEGYQSPSTGFKWTFGIISGLVILWSMFNKFFISKIEQDIRDRQVQLKHDYEIDVGNAEKIKWLWFSGEQKLAIFNALQLIIYGALIIVVIVGIRKALMEVQGIILIIIVCYIIAFFLKFTVITILKGSNYDEEQK